jgi:hypothetical protein
MKKLILSTLSAFVITVAAGLTAGPSQAAPTFNGLQGMPPINNIENAQFFWRGRSYCWYWNGWRGPGWYWCGYAFRRGLGWGGGHGFRGWVVPGRPIVRPGRPGMRPPIHRPGIRPPIGRPPIARPPGGRPPGGIRPPGGGRPPGGMRPPGGGRPPGGVMPGGGGRPPGLVR